MIRTFNIIFTFCTLLVLALMTGCATMDPLYAMLTGLIAGIVVIVSSKILEQMKLDDVVGAVAVHGFAGAWGTLADYLSPPLCRGPFSF